jgi:hypothetical protein
MPAPVEEFQRGDSMVMADLNVTIKKKQITFRPFLEITLCNWASKNP